MYLLLKSSDFVTHDLTMPFKHCEDYNEQTEENKIKYCLVLREWMDINPGIGMYLIIKSLFFYSNQQFCPKVSPTNKSTFADLLQQIN